MNTAEQRTQIDTKNKSRRSRVLTGAASAVAISAALLASACSTEGQEATPKTTVTTVAPTTTRPPETTTTTETVVPTNEYMNSPQRNETIEAAVQAAGLDILAAANSQQLGYFDFYNSETGEWQSQVPTTTGWGSLQHNPQYGGSPEGVSIHVYRLEDGSFDLNRGIQGISLDVNDTQSVHLERMQPEGDSSWAVSVYDSATRTSHEAAFSQSAQETQFIDITALQLMESRLAELGITR
jgi:hypothetical protein